MIVPPFVSLFCGIGLKNGRLGGGDNPTFWRGWGCEKWSGMPCLSGFLGVGGVLGCARGFFVWGMGLAGVLEDGPCWASLGLSEPLVRRLGVVRVWVWWVVLDHADESDDGAQAAYVVAWEEERLVYGVVFGDAENAVGMIHAFLHAFDEYPLARFEDIDGAPLEEADVCDFAASEEVATIIERHHGVARHPNKEVCSFVFELWYDIALAVLQTHTAATFCRETSDCIEGYEWDAGGRWCRCGRLGRCSRCGWGEHWAESSEEPFCINIEL